MKTNGNEPLRPGDIVSYLGGGVRLLLRTTKILNGTDCGLLRREDCWWFGGFYAPLATLRRYDDELHGGEVRR